MGVNNLNRGLDNDINAELFRLLNESKPDEETIDLNDGWDLINAYMYEYGMARAQIESYNYLTDKGIALIIDSLPVVEAKCDYRYEVHTIKFSDGRLSKPHLVEQDSTKKIIVDEKSKSIKKDLSSVTFTDPKISKDRKAAYTSKLYVKCTWTITTRKPGEEEKVVTRVYPNMGFGYIPVMIKSVLCPLSNMDEASLYDIGEDPMDQGGYFIINGGEKVLISQERMIYNHIMVSQKSVSGNKMCFEAEIRSSREMCYKPASQFVIRYKVMAKGEGAATVRSIALPYLKQGQEIPVGIIFKALGIEKDEELCFMVSHNLQDRRLLTLLRGSLKDANKEVKNQDEALEYIGARTTTTFEKEKDKEKERIARMKCARDLLTRDLFPHVGESFKAKAYFLGVMINKLLSVVLGRVKEDDRDHYKNKRIITAGQLLGELIQQIMTKSVKEFRATLIRYLDEGRPLDISGMIKEKAITQGIKYCISTGNWSANKIVGTKNGVSAVLIRISYLAYLSHLNRVNTPTGKDGKMTKPRHLAGTHWGYTCGNETPESQSVGLVKNLALMCAVSLGDYSFPFMDIVYSHGLKKLLDCSKEEIVKLTKVFVNGNWVGMIDNPYKLTSELKELKRTMNINSETSVVYDVSNNQVRIATDPGRTMRPLYVVRDNKLSITKERIQKMKNNYKDGWFQIMMEGHVEYVDVDESEHSLISMFAKDLNDPTKKYTHCELHPGTILGVSAGTIPFANSNPGARNTFQCAMGKQAISFYANNFDQRIDTVSQILWYPQKPLVSTKHMELMGLNDYPGGMNAIVAICCYTGYTQEDANIIAQGFIDRGGMRSTHYRLFTDEQKKLGNHHSEEFELPDKDTIGIKQGSYRKCDEDGIVGVGEIITTDDVVISKNVPLPGKDDKFTKRDHSTVNRNTERGIVDRVLISTNPEGHKFTKIRVRSTRIPELGDKYSSRHGQKGTTGMIYPDEDMPFSASGMRPDLLINSHAIPSRMTIGHLLESLFAKAGCFTGKISDATIFEDRNRDEVERALAERGFEFYAKEMMCNGFDGLPMECRIFMGPVYYQKLKHMVIDKIHSRARGPVSILTRQPVEGRAREGGLRFGEMERDCLISHGAAGFLRERLFTCSDPYVIPVCANPGCGLIANENGKTGALWCRPCRGSNVKKVRIPYAAKLLFQELYSMQIAPRIQLE